MKKIIFILSLIMLCILYILATPIITSYHIFSAVKSGDDTELSRHIDYPVLKQNLTAQIQAKIDEKFKPQSDNAIVKALADFGKKMLVPTVDTVVTPHNVSLILQTGAMSTTLLDSDEKNNQQKNNHNNYDNDISMIEDLNKKLDFRYLNINEFEVSIHKINTHVILKREGIIDWKVSNIILNSD